MLKRRFRAWPIDYPRIAQVDETAVLGIRDIFSTTALLDLIFPPECAVCELQLDSGKLPLVCKQCVEKLVAPSNSIRCPKCGSVNLPVPAQDGLCRLCVRSQSPVVGSICLNNYEGFLRQTVIEAKRKSGDQLAFQLGRLLAAENRKTIEHLAIRIVTPVPAYWSKRIKRGYHATEWIARGMACELKQLKLRKCVKSVRQTQKQALLNTKQRKANVKNAFTAKSMKTFTNQPVLVVDDVMTSGATITEIAWTLLEAGASGVYAGFLARGIGHESV